MPENDSGASSAPDQIAARIYSGRNEYSACADLYGESDQAAEYHLEDKIREMNMQLVDLTRTANRTGESSWIYRG